MQRDFKLKSLWRMHVNHSQINSSKKCGFENHETTKGFHHKTARQTGHKPTIIIFEDNHLFGNSVCVVTIHLFLTLKTRHMVQLNLVSLSTKEIFLAKMDVACKAGVF